VNDSIPACLSAIAMPMPPKPLPMIRMEGAANRAVCPIKPARAITGGQPGDNGCDRIDHGRVHEHWRGCVRLLAVLGLTVANGPGCAHPSSRAGRRPDISGDGVRASRVEDGLLPAVIIRGQRPQMTLADRMKRYNVPGVSVAVINHGQIEWVGAYGVTEAGGSVPVTPETLFQAASISKPVSTLGALALVEQGQLALDGDVNAQLKSWKVPENQLTQRRKVTLRGLVTHSAGLTVHGFRGYAAGEPVPTTMQVLDGAKPANSEPVRVDSEPGRRSRYSGGGFVVMQLLMVDVTGRSFPVLMRELVLDRIGMARSTYEQPLPKPRSGDAAAGHDADGHVLRGKWFTYPEMAPAGLWTTAGDLARFAIELQRSKAGRSNHVLSAAMTTAMLTRQSGDFGLGLVLGGEDDGAHFAHNGGNAGFRCKLFAYSETGKGAVVMTNGDQGDTLADEILRSIAREYGWPDWKPVERTEVRVDAALLIPYVGEYDVGGKVTVTLRDGRLQIERPGDPVFQLHPSSTTEFFLAVEDIRVVFTRDARGQVTGLTAYLPASTVTGTKVK
jgi:CubicO group peptidase (beta-lactamase class C family)